MLNRTSDKQPAHHGCHLAFSLPSKFDIFLQSGMTVKMGFDIFWHF